MAIAQEIHSLHPGRLDIRSLKLAMAFGSLELVQWVMANRTDRVCCPPGLENLCVDCVESAAHWIGDKDTVRIASWLIDQGVLSVTDLRWHETKMLLSRSGLGVAAHAALLKSAELVRWCDARGLLTDEVLCRLVDDAMSLLNHATIGIVLHVLERGLVPPNMDQFVDALVTASCTPDHEALVEFVLESAVFDELRPHFVYAPTRPGGAKVLQWSHEYGEKHAWVSSKLMRTIPSTAGHVATMQWLIEERGATALDVHIENLSEQEAIGTMEWLHSTGHGVFGIRPMELAAIHGHLRAVQWLHANYPRRRMTREMDFAAACGHLELVQWFHANQFACSSFAMDQAAARGHLDVVKWLSANREEGSVIEAMVYAAANGELEVGRWCLDQGGCAACGQHQLFARWSVFRREAFDAKVGQPEWHEQSLYALRMLAAHQASAATLPCLGRCFRSNRQYGFSVTNLASIALQTGNLLLAKYLHEHHKELFTAPAQMLQPLLSRGYQHAGAIAWLCARYPSAPQTIRQR